LVVTASCNIVLEQMFSTYIHPELCGILLTISELWSLFFYHSVTALCQSVALCQPLTLASVSLR
jgi:hypothetical protein